MIKKGIMISAVAVYALCAVGVADTAEFREATKLFDDKQYPQSMAILDKLYQQDSSDTQVNFYLGRIYYEMGLFEKSLAAFDRVLIMDETHARTKLEQGRTYIAMNMLKDAKRVFEEVLNSDAPQAVKDNVLVILEQIDNAESRSKTNYLFSVGIGYDSNVLSSPSVGDFVSSLSYNYPQLDTLTLSDSSKPKTIRAYLTQWMVNVRNSYDIGRRDGWYIDSSGLLLSQNYHYIHDDTYNSSDLLFGNIAVGPSYTTKEYKVSIPLTYDRVQYAYDQLMHTVHIAPKIDIPLDKTTLLSAYAKYQHKMYFYTENKGKNANVAESGISISKTIDTHNISLGYSISQEKKVYDDSTDKNIEKKSDTYTIGLGEKIDDTFDIKYQLSYKTTDYDDAPMLATPDTPSGANREDTSISHMLALTQKISKEMSMMYSYTTQESDSNNVSTVYNKDTATVVVNYAF